MNLFIGKHTIVIDIVGTLLTIVDTKSSNAFRFGDISFHEL